MKRCLKSFALLLILLVGYFAALIHFTSEFAPAANVKTYQDLLRQGLPMKRAVLLPSIPGHVCVFGDAKKLWWTVPSGPPAYHFDATGRLIDFTLDSGDSPKFIREYAIYHGKKIALADLPARFHGAAR